LRKGLNINKSIQIKQLQLYFKYKTTLMLDPYENTTKLLQLLKKKKVIPTSLTFEESNVNYPLNNNISYQLFILNK